jgi:anhydro-N-acetylmuramic acid kinase
MKRRFIPDRVIDTGRSRGYRPARFGAIVGRFERGKAKSMSAARRTAIGLMSGTSMDGVDVAVIETDGEAVFTRGPALTMPYGDAIRGALLAVARDPARAEHDALADLSETVTDLNATAVRRLMAEAGLAPEAVDVVGMHGQTILHRPERRFTRQLGNGARLAAALGIPCVNDFRSADVAAGGQGAPFAPLYHAALARGLPRPLAVLNLGGVGNVTIIEDGAITAFDTGPASAMIDDWVQRHTGARYDEDGRIAATGTVAADRLAALLANPYFDARRRSRWTATTSRWWRSTGCRWRMAPPPWPPSPSPRSPRRAGTSPRRRSAGW